LDNTGASVARVSFDAWGNLISGAPTGYQSYQGMYGWDGYQSDAATSLYYNHARYYDPQSQRWISQDPMGFNAGDSNLYRYVNNPPTNAIDPSGLQPAYNQAGADKLVTEAFDLFKKSAEAMDLYKTGGVKDVKAKKMVWAGQWDANNKIVNIDPYMK